MTSGVAPRPLRLVAADGVPLGATLWPAAPGAMAGPVVVISPATSVRARYYGRFAAWLAAQGLDTLTFDYRGIGESRPARLRGFRAGWADWGELDLEAALRCALEHFPGRELALVGHSIGGLALGLAPSAGRAARLLSVGAQYAYWRDYAARERPRMLLKWHVAMPALTALFGYFPARRLGWMEDTPAGVARDWSRMGARLEDQLRDGAALKARLGGVTAPLLAISLADDPHGTPAAVERLLAYFSACPRHRLHLDPVARGLGRVGHFAFFHSRFAATLWPLARDWLAAGRLPPGATPWPAPPASQPG
ncbi:alpha/beta fold hydrolase [Teichococcus cervicalis]|uniref:Hydrolase, alpha/beta domain protein n=1 Tax=Pseudoroseomonas cervicalis ATCC 49957 TaxID=525371 RepID=D5RNG9_9PROT|nr:alpha/beta fold hydrolase [Pseudoroseomonas cervicalis]EFH11149.1 hydrolase, alpha/beta domain protein [Pseudoroseomonas cervicalis ATCC 49957]